LRHFEGKTSAARDLYEQSLDADREKGILLMDQLLGLPKEERMPLEALAKYRRARLKMSLEDWAGLSDDDVRSRLRSIREDLASVPELARDGSLDPAKVSENAAYWIAYTRSMILPSRRLIALGEADYAGATEAYLRMPMRGQANSVNSCLHLLRKLCEENNLRPALASDSLRLLMTFYLSSAGGSFRESVPDDEVLRVSYVDWLDLLKENKVDVAFARRHVAIIQYRCERLQDCLETAQGLPKEDPLRRLLLSRCNLPPRPRVTSITCSSTCMMRMNYASGSTESWGRSRSAQANSMRPYASSTKVASVTTPSTSRNACLPSKNSRPTWTTAAPPNWDRSNTDGISATMASMTWNTNFAPG
jgi:hypothetical protein